MRQILVLSVMALLSFECFCQWNPGLKENLEQVIKMEVISYGGSGEETGRRKVSFYENGRLAKMQRYEGEKLLQEESYSYDVQEQKEVISRKSTSEYRNSVTINYFDEKARLKKSELYHKGAKKPKYLQSNFKYDENGQLGSYQVTSFHSNGKTKRHLQVFHPDKYTLRRVTTGKKSDDKEFEIRIEYDSLFKSALMTSVYYEYFSNKVDKPESKGPLLGIKSKDIGWVEKDTINTNGARRIVVKKTVQDKYYYDNHGNWIEVFEVRKSGEEKLRAKRIIEYRDN